MLAKGGHYCTVDVGRGELAVKPGYSIGLPIYKTVLLCQLQGEVAGENRTMMGRFGQNAPLEAPVTRVVL